MCKKCQLKEIAAAAVNQVEKALLYQTFTDALAACLLAKARYMVADSAYSARGETDSPEAKEYRDALDLYKINTLLLAHAAQAYEKGGKS